MTQCIYCSEKIISLLSTWTYPYAVFVRFRKMPIFSSGRIGFNTKFNCPNAQYFWSRCILYSCSWQPWTLHYPFTYILHLPASSHFCLKIKYVSFKIYPCSRLLHIKYMESSFYVQQQSLVWAINNFPISFFFYFKFHK